MAATPEQVNELLRLAYQGNLKAQFNLGEIYHDLNDLPKAVYWHRKAAQSGYADSQCAMGLCYYHGVSGLVVPDYCEAVRWYRLASNQNQRLAILNLATCFLKGAGVPTDYIEAYGLCYLVAKDFSSEYQPICHKLIKQIEIYLNPSQIQEGKARSVEIERMIRSRVY